MTRYSGYNCLLKQFVYIFLFGSCLSCSDEGGSRSPITTGFNLPPYCRNQPAIIFDPENKRTVMVDSKNLSPFIAAIEGADLAKSESGVYIRLQVSFGNSQCSINPTVQVSSESIFLFEENAYQVKEKNLIQLLRTILGDAQSVPSAPTG